MNLERNKPRHNHNTSNYGDEIEDNTIQTENVNNVDDSLEKHLTVIEKESKEFTSRFNVLKSLVELVGKHGKSTVLWALLIFMVYGNIIKDAINPPKKQMEETLDKYSRRAELEHKKGLEMRQNANVLIPGILETILYRTEADRVVILELHNGGVNNHNLPFNHFTATYETVSDIEIMDYIKDQYQNQYTSSYNYVMGQLYKYGYLYVDDIDNVPVAHWTKKIKKNGVKSAYFYAIYGDKEPVGILSITSSTHKLNEVDISRIINPYAQRIGVLLQGIEKY